MIKVCEHCSNVNYTELKALVEEDQFSIKCIGHCEGHDGKSFGFIDGELVIVESPEAFTAAAREKLHLATLESRS